MDVLLGDLLKSPGDVVISTNTTFDTEMSTSLIARDSLQGQFTDKYYSGRIPELDRELAHSLQGTDPSKREDAPGKTDEYPIGTVARIVSHGQTFYWLAMARLDENGMARTSPDDVEAALVGLWKFLDSDAELGDVYMALIGTGRGRLARSRKRIEAMVQSFISNLEGRKFAKSLTIVVRPDDREVSAINLFEVKDMLQKNIEL